MILLVQRYLIAIDLDGTLLKDNRQISMYSKVVIQKLIEQGHYVVIATGRSNRMSILYYDELKLNTPLINSNGAFIHHPNDPNWGTFHVPLDMNTAKDIIEISFSLNAENLLAAIHDNVIVERFDQHIVDFYESGSDTGVIKVGPLKEKLKEEPTLMLVYPHYDKLDKLTEYLNDIHAETIDHRNWGEPFHIIEIMNKSMNKAVAVKKVADYYGVPRERIIAFGDETNDLHMLEYAGIGVAMANGVDDAKNVADQITKSNEEDGVAVFLADYFNIKESIRV